MRPTGDYYKELLIEHQGKLRPLQGDLSSSSLSSFLPVRRASGTRGTYNPAWVAHSTSAFTRHPVDLSPPVSDSPADPGQLSDKPSNGQSGGTNFGLPGRFKLQFSGPSLGTSPNNPFVEFPSTVFVPREHR